MKNPAITPRWYFLCDRCQAKWFDVAQPSRCPRCGDSAKSKEKLVPPWQIRPGHLGDAARIGGQNGPTNNVPCPSHWLTVLVTASQLAGWLQVSKRSVYRLRIAGQLPKPIRLGGAVRWRAADIEAWLAKDCQPEAG